jgi:two-component system nitrate/nitrite response regulator NarL
MIKLALLDDHQIVIDGLKLLLDEKKNFSIVAEATAAQQMLQLLEKIEVHVLITDIMMAGMNGYELSVLVKEKYPQIKILALSMSEEGGMITKMIEDAKVDGYIPKASGKQELVNAIQSIVNGTSYFSTQVKEQYDFYKKIKSENEDLNLTNRELQIIECIIQHLSNKEIAAKLFISERTVETHLKNIYRKTNTKGVATLVQFVKEHKLLP